MTLTLSTRSLEALRLPALAATLLAATLCTGTTTAQDCPRPVQQWSNVTGGSNTDNVQVSTPTPSSPSFSAFLSFGGVSPSQLVHLAYEIEDDAGGNVESIAYRRSVDGGCSFGPEQIIWQGRTGESIDFHRLVSTGDQVYVFVETNRDSTMTPSGTTDYCWVVGSPRQGMVGSFSSRLVSTGVDTVRTDGTLLGDVDHVSASAGLLSAYVVFEAAFQDDGTGASTNNGGAFLRRVFFDGSGNLTFENAEETRLETTPPGMFDVDFPQVASDGDLFIATWQDPRGGIDNDQWSRSGTSIATLLPEVNHSNFTSSITSELSFVAVDGNSCYVLMTDERNTGISGIDEAILSISNMGGMPGTFTQVVVDQAPVGADVDVAQIAADRGFVHVFYDDNRGGTDDLFVVSSNNFGAQFLAGTAVENPLTTGGQSPLTISNSRIPSGVAVGDRAAFPFQLGSGSANDLLIAITSDGGLSWQRCAANIAGTSLGDNDDRALAFSTRGDLIVGMEDNRAMPGTTENQIYTTGVRLPLLRFNTMTNVFEMTGASPSAVGQSAYLLSSLTPPACGAFPIDPFAGWQSDFVIDPFTSTFLGLPGTEAFVDASGNASWVLPNFATLFGLPFYHAVFQFDFGTPATTGLSDTILINP